MRIPIREMAIEFKPYRWALFAAILLLLCSAGLGVFQPWWVGKIIDDGFLAKDTGKLYKGVLVLLGVEAGRLIFLYAQGIVFAVCGQKIMQSLRVRVFRHLLRLEVNQLDHLATGRLVTRATNDVASLAELFSAQFLTVAVQAVSIVAVLLTIARLEWRLFLWVALTLIPVLACSYYFSERLKLSYRIARSRLSGLNAFLAETIQGMRLLQAHHQEANRVKRYAQRNDHFTSAQNGTVHVYAYFQPTITLGQGIAMGFVLYFGAKAVGLKTLPPGEFIAISTYVLQLFTPIRDLADRWNIFLSGMISADRLFQVLHWPKESEVPACTRSLTGLRIETGKTMGVSAVAGNGALTENGLVGKLPVNSGGASPLIEFDKVVFQYRSHFPKVLDGVTLRIFEKERLGIVGETGAGKSTLFQLLTRMRTVTSGSIRVEGKAIEDWNLFDLREQFGWVQQEIQIFAGSVRDNLTLFSSDEARWVQFCKKLESLGPLGWPQGRIHWDWLDRAIVSEGGSNLSQGEKQWIACARVAYKNPRIWLLDEATSYLDSFTEEQLLKWFQLFSEGKTQLAIAHRLSTLRDFSLRYRLAEKQLTLVG